MNVSTALKGTHDYIFIYDISTLYTTLPHNLIKEKLLNLIERDGPSKRPSINEGTLYLACNAKKAFLLLQTKEGINFVLVRMYVTPYRISWIIHVFTLDLVISYTDKVLVFQLVHIVLLL